MTLGAIAACEYQPAFQGARGAHAAGDVCVSGRYICLCRQEE